MKIAKYYILPMILVSPLFQLAPQLDIERLCLFDVIRRLYVPVEVC